MEKYGFVYIWHDVKRKMYYIGCHWGTEDDGYICSSNRMRSAYRRRPKDFKRRILTLIYTSRYDMFNEENKWLSMISDDMLGKKYYNLRNNTMHWSSNSDKYTSIRKKISSTKQNYWKSDKGSEMKDYLRNLNKERNVIPPSRKGKIPWNKGLTKETDNRVANNADAIRKPKRKK